MGIKGDKMSEEKEKWFSPKRHSGWHKEQKATTRRRKLLAATDKRLSMRNRYLQAARMIGSLANVTRDVTTSQKAKVDADYFYTKAEKAKV